jgi:hypothetical protein
MDSPQSRQELKLEPPTSDSTRRFSRKLNPSNSFHIHGVVSGTQTLSVVFEPSDSVGRLAQSHGDICSQTSLVGYNPSPGNHLA